MLPQRRRTSMVQWLRLGLSMQEMRVPFLVRNLGPNIPHSQNQYRNSRSNGVQQSCNKFSKDIKTVHIKKILKIKEAEEKLCASSQVCKWKQSFSFSLPLCL